MQLKASLNCRFFRALVGVKLPSIENYTAYVSGIAEVAADLEGLNDYRPENTKYMTKNVGGSKGINGREEYMSYFNGDGDYKMGNNALLAAFRNPAVDRAERIVAGVGTREIRINSKKKR